MKERVKAALARVLDEFRGFEHLRSENVPCLIFPATFYEKGSRVDRLLTWLTRVTEAIGRSKWNETLMNIVKKITKVSELPLMNVAEAWGIRVNVAPRDGIYYGGFNQYDGVINLSSREEAVFFHELAHAAHRRVLGEYLKVGQDWKQEIVAELSAAVLCSLYASNPSRYLGNNYISIAFYAMQGGLTPVQGCFEVIEDVEKVLDLIVRQASA